MDDVCFETLMPERVLQIPSKRTDSKTLVQFGIRIINQTANSHHFLLFFARPEFWQSNQQKVSRFGPNINGSYNPLISDFQLLMPGDSINFLTTGYFRWESNQLKFVFREKDGSYWIFSDFHTGKYLIQFTYENQCAAWKQRRKPSGSIDLSPVYNHSTSQNIKFENTWVGNVSTPEIEFYLIQKSDT